MRFILCTPVLVSLTLAACGGGGNDTPVQASGGATTPANAESAPDAGEVAATTPANTGPAKAWDSAAGIAQVTGTVTFAGDAPKRRKVDMGSDPKCESMHSESLMDESAVVGAGGELANVFVWVRKGLDSWEFPTPSEPVFVDQKGCAYSPHVLGVQVGQPVEIRNGDPVSHNVHGYAKKNSSFNQTQAPDSAGLTQVFKRSEVFVSLKCDIHGWMNTYVGVVENPFFAVSAEDGTFDLGQLPPGTYQVAARHEVFGMQKQDITIAEGGGPQDLSFTFSEDE